MPPDLLHSLCTLGLPAELPDLEFLATAAQLRVVSASATFWQSLDEIERAMCSDEVLMNPPLSAWYQRSMLFTLRDTWRRHNSIPAIKLILCHKPHHLHQRLCYRHLAGANGLAKALLVLVRRFSKSAIPERDLEASLATLRVVLLSRLPSSCKFALLRTVCNAWNTSARYHQPVAGCLFGCTPPAEDRLVHYLTCPCVAASSLRLLNVDISLLRSSPLALLLRLSHHELRLKTMLFVDAVFFT